MMFDASQFSKMQEEDIEPGKVNLIFFTRFSSQNLLSLSFLYLMLVISLLIKLYLAPKKIQF